MEKPKNKPKKLENACRKEKKRKKIEGALTRDMGRQLGAPLDVLPGPKK